MLGEREVRFIFIDLLPAFCGHTRMDEQLHEQTQLTRLSPTKEETRCPENTFMVTYRVCGKNCCAVTTVFTSQFSSEKISFFLMGIV
ncbi:hypothetical protein Y032_0015g2652 [Ancylostoma ceylanicum]|uniref:Uncharacterized protein n=1 Tax=Ancylostoma ceylanicum TaxID=53326 RepID=A0A016V844_9BILA|nr:hypothetical protein Y032_0015g2652 [Ancylostoma ceylanicum]